MVVTRQSTANREDQVTQTEGEISRVSAGWGAPRDEHEDQYDPCVHANLPAAEQEENEWSPRLSPSFARRSLGDGTGN